MLTSVLPPFGVLTIKEGSGLLGFKFNFLAMLYDINECVHLESNSKYLEIL